MSHPLSPPFIPLYVYIFQFKVLVATRDLTLSFSFLTTAITGKLCETAPKAVYTSFWDSCDHAVSLAVLIPQEDFAKTTTTT